MLPCVRPIVVTLIDSQVISFDSPYRGHNKFNIARTYPYLNKK